MTSAEPRTLILFLYHIVLYENKIDEFEAKMLPLKGCSNTPEELYGYLNLFQYHQSRVNDIVRINRWHEKTYDLLFDTLNASKNIGFSDFIKTIKYPENNTMRPFFKFYLNQIKWAVLCILDDSCQQLKYDISTELSILSDNTLKSEKNKSSNKLVNLFKDLDNKLNLFCKDINKV